MLFHQCGFINVVSASQRGAGIPSVASTAPRPTIGTGWCCGLKRGSAHTHKRKAASYGRRQSVLLQSLAINPIPGVAVVASCRTERLDSACGDARCRLFPVPPFTASLVRLRDPGTTPAELSALHARSRGNPRCLDALLTAGRPYDGPQPGGAKATAGEVLDALIRQRISAAEEHAEAKGAR